MAQEREPNKGYLSPSHLQGLTSAQIKIHASFVRENGDRVYTSGIKYGKSEGNRLKDYATALEAYADARDKAKAAAHSVYVWAAQQDPLQHRQWVPQLERMIKDMEKRIALAESTPKEFPGVTDIGKPIFTYNRSGSVGSSKLIRMQGRKIRRGRSPAP